MVSWRVSRAASSKADLPQQCSLECDVQGALAAVPDQVLVKKKERHVAGPVFYYKEFIKQQRTQKVDELPTFLSN